jgi:hypothetical protein
LCREDVAELGRVLVGAEDGRRGDEEITVFDSTGLAVQDLAVAIAVYERWREEPESRGVRGRERDRHRIIRRRSRSASKEQMASFAGFGLNADTPEREQFRRRDGVPLARRPARRRRTCISLFPQPTMPPRTRSTPP